MNSNIYKKKILITVKTYPTLSSKYDELVCTAGITEDWEWTRIYPMPFRKFDDYIKYSKYQWVEIDLIKNTSDVRPESFRPYHTPPNIKLLEKVSTWWDKKWSYRKEIVLKNVFTDLEKLILENKSKKWTSLAIFKPTQVLDFIIEEDEREWDSWKLKIIEERSKQINLFEETKVFKVKKKLPYKFKYKFLDDKWKESCLMVEDWEVWELFWRYWQDIKNEKYALEKVRQKYFDDFAKTKDLHFFVWTTREFDGWAHNPFVIIWTFHPPKDERVSLF